MTSRTPKDPLSRGVSDPPGVLPKNVNYLVLAGIAVVVIVASMFSGQKAKPVEQAKAPAGPSPNQLKNFRDMLEKQARDVEEAKRKLEERRLREEKTETTREQVRSAAASAPDAFDERRRARAAAAPFASNLALRIVEKTEERSEKDALDRALQVVLRAEERTERAAEPKPAKGDSETKESGEPLPAKEGDLFRLYEGTPVRTSLLNRLDGAFTGPVRCEVVEPVLSKDGSAILIPKGSLFFGKASRVEAQNQARLAVTFKRLLMPNGYSVELEAAPGLDRFGETGLKDKVNNHRFRTFGLSGAIGLLGGLALYGGRGNPYSAGVANATGRAASTTLNHYLNAVPTITIREGHPVNVYIPKDLLLPKYEP